MKKYASIILIGILLCSLLLPLYKNHREVVGEETQYIPDHNFPFEVKEIPEGIFGRVVPEARILGSDVFRLYDEASKYIFEWMVAPGGKIKDIVIADLDGDGTYGYVAIEGDKVIAHRGSSMGTTYWSVDIPDAKILIAGDVDGDSYDDIGIAASSGLYIIDSSGTQIYSNNSVSVDGVLDKEYIASERMYIVVTTDGRLVKWNTGEATSRNIGSIDVAVIAGPYIFCAEGNNLKVFDLNGKSLSERSFESEIVSISASVGSNYYVAVGLANKKVSLLLYSGSITSLWTTSINTLPQFICVAWTTTSNSGDPYVYVGGGNKVYRIYYGYIMNSLSTASPIRRMLTGDVDGNGYTDIIIGTELGDVIITDYKLGMLSRGSFGEEVNWILYGKIESADETRLLIAKDFEVILGDAYGASINIISKFSTGNRFYTILIDEDDVGGYRIVAGGEDGYIYYFTTSGILEDRVYIGGTIRQILKIADRYVINNGSVVFVDGGSIEVSNISAVSKIAVGDIDGDLADEVVVLSNGGLYKIDDVDATYVYGTSYGDFVLAKCYSDKGKLIVAKRGGTVDILYGNGTLVESKSLGDEIVDFSTARNYNDEAVIMVYSNASKYYVAFMFDGNVYVSQGYVSPYPQRVVGMDYDGDGVGEIATVFSDGVIRILEYDPDQAMVIDTGVSYSTTSTIRYITSGNLDSDERDELILCLNDTTKYYISLLDDDLSTIFSDLVSGPIYTVSGGDIDGDGATELLLGMSGMEYLNRRIISIRLVSPSTTGLMGWWSVLQVRWSIRSEDPVDHISIYLGTKQIARLGGDQSIFNISFEVKGNYTIKVEAVSINGLACSVGFWYYYDPEAEPVPLELHINTPEDGADIWGPIVISGTASGLPSINVTVVIDNNAEIINASTKTIGFGRYYWEAYWDPFGYYGTHTITVYATNGTHAAVKSITINVMAPSIIVWARYDGNPDPNIIGTFLPNITVVNRIYVRVAGTASPISRVLFDINGVIKEATYDSGNGYWYIDMDMGMFYDDVVLRVIAEGKNGGQVSSTVMIDILPLPLWMLKLVEQFTGGVIGIEWDPSQRCYVAQTDVIGLIEFLEKTGILSKLGVNFTIPKEIPIFGEKLTLLDLGVVIGFKLFITKYVSVWVKGNLVGQIFGRSVIASVYGEGLFNDELELVRIMISALFGITNIVTFTYQHIIPFTIAGIPGTVRLGITFTVSAFVGGEAIISGNWTIDYFLVDFNPQIEAGAWAYVDIALGLVSVGLIISPTVDIHGIYEYVRDLGGSWALSAELTIPYKVVISLFYGAIKETLVSGVLGPYTWSTSSGSRARTPTNSDARRGVAKINAEPFVRDTLLQQARIASDGSQEMVVWVHGEELAYATYNGYEWKSDLLTYDGYPKSNPTLISMGDKWMVIWTQMDDGENMESLRLYYSIYDGNGWTAPQRITSDDVPEGYPEAIYYDGKVYLVYLRDPDKDLSTKDWELYYTVYDGEEWSTPTMLSSITPVVSPSIASVGDKIYVAFISDYDGDFDTAENQELWLTDLQGNHILVTSDKIVRDVAIYGYNGIAKIAWVEINGDGEATYILKTADSNGKEITNINVVRESESQLSQPKFTMDNGKLRLFWITNEGGSDGDIDSAVLEDGVWVRDMEQRDDAEIWSIDFTSDGSEWYGVISEPYLKGVHVVSGDKHFYITAEEVPIIEHPERYVSSAEGEEGGISIGTVILGVPLGIVIGLIGAVVQLRGVRKFEIVE